MVGPCAALASPSTPPHRATSSRSTDRPSRRSQTAAWRWWASATRRTSPRLLNSPPDAISPLSRAAPSSPQKVKSLTIMGGGYPSRPVRTTSLATPRRPRPSPPTGPPRSSTRATRSATGCSLATRSPRCIPRTRRCASRTRRSSGRARTTGPSTSPRCYHAARPDDPLLTEVGPGTNAIDGSGGDVFTPGAGNEYYLSLANATSLSHDARGAARRPARHDAPGDHLHLHSPEHSPKVGDTYTRHRDGRRLRQPRHLLRRRVGEVGLQHLGQRGHVHGATGSCVIDAEPVRQCGVCGSPQVQQTVADLARRPRRSPSPPRPRPRPRSAAPTPSARRAAAPATPSPSPIDASSKSVCSISASVVTFTAHGQLRHRREPVRQCGVCGSAAGPADRRDLARPPGDHLHLHTPDLAQGRRHLRRRRDGRRLRQPRHLLDRRVVEVGLQHLGQRGRTFTAPTGSCVIDANQSGSAAYAAAPQVQQTVAISLVPQAISFTSTSRPRPRSASTYAVGATGGGSGLPVTFSIDAVTELACSIASAVVTFAGGRNVRHRREPAWQRDLCGSAAGPADRRRSRSRPRRSPSPPPSRPRRRSATPTPSARRAAAPATPSPSPSTRRRSRSAASLEAS